MLGRIKPLVALGLLIGLILGGIWRALSTRAPAANPANSANSAEQTPRIPMIDVHVHLGPAGIGHLLALMKSYGFDHVVNLSGGSPGRGLEEQLAAAAPVAKAVTVFTTLAFEEAALPDYGERMAVALRRAHAMGARGLKIAKALGLGLTAPDRTLIPVDDPKLDIVFETAAELGMPIAIHSGDPKAFWLPVDYNNERADELRANPGWALYGEAVPSFDEILNQLERRIARHPKTQFISVHFGNCAEEPDRVARMLRTYPNLYIDTAARIPEIGRQDPQKMRAFYVEFQDRVLFGSDLGVGRSGTPLFLGSQGKEVPTDADEKRFFSATHRYFETADRDFAHPTPIQGKWSISGVNLPREILEKIYFRNAARLLSISIK